MKNIKEIKGDLLNCEANIFAHCANAQLTFGAGLAAQIRRKYPEVYEADCQTKKDDIGKLGSFSFAKTYDEKICYNLYGQRFYGGKRPMNYEYIYTALEGMRDHIITCTGKDDSIVGFPARMASDLAGGSWLVVKSMIEEVFLDFKYQVLIVDFKN